MSVDLKYVSSKGIEFDLLDFDVIKLYKADFHNVKWVPEVVQKQYGTTINRFTKGPQLFDVTFRLKGDPAQRKSQIDAFIYQTEYDIAKMSPGRLWWNNQYIDVYFNEHDCTPVEDGQTWTEVSGQLYACFPFWIEEEVWHIDPEHYEPIPQRDDNKGYPLDRDMAYAYTYSYPYTGASGVLHIDSPFGCDYRLEVWGPIPDYFRVVVGDNVLQVNYPINGAQKLIIDSRDTLPIDQKCYVLNPNGTTINIFDYRDPNSLLFERFIGDEVSLYIDRDYKLDLTLYLERSAPI